MKLWLLRPRTDLEYSPWAPWFDKAFGFVIVAQTEGEARKIAFTETGEYRCGEKDEGTGFSQVYDQPPVNPWDERNATCIELNTENFAEPQIIMDDFARA